MIMSKIDKSIFKAFDYIKANDELKTTLLNLNNKSSSKKNKIIKIVGGLASLTAVVAFFIFFQRMWNIIDFQRPITNNTNPIVTDTTDNKPSLPKIAFEFKQDGQGFGGVMLKNVIEFIGDNPILGMEDEVKELPVYKNPYYVEAIKPMENNANDDEEIDPMKIKEKYLEKQHSTENIDIDSLRNKSKSIIDAFGFNPKSDEEILNGSFGGVPSSLITKGDDYTIDVGNNGSVRIFFKNSISHPENLNYDDAIEKNKELVKFYYNIYKEKLKTITGLYYDGIKTSCDYTYNGDPIVRSYLYSKIQEDSLQNKILSYNFNTLSMDLDNSGNLFGISIIENTLNEKNKIGDYPVISKEEAISEFKNGNFAPNFLIKDEDLQMAQIEGIELNYYNQSNIQNYVPVYTLYVSFGEKLEGYYDDSKLPNGLKTYLIFYVPAISKDYLNGIEFETKFN